MFRPYIKQRPQRRNEGDFNKTNNYQSGFRNWNRNVAPYEVPARNTINYPNFYQVSSAIMQPMDFYNIPQPYLPVKKHVPLNVRHLEVTQNIPGTQNFSDFDQWRPPNSYNEGSNRGVKHSWNRSNISEAVSNNNDDENYVPPNKILRTNNGNKSPTSVDLLVTNLDQNLDSQELKKVLLTLFQEYATVLNLSLFQQTDGNLAANVRVASTQEAQYAISQLHRRKIGHKRIIISHNQTSTTNPQVLRTQVVTLLQEVPGYRMPLFQFRELLEVRYRNSVPVSELYKLKDVCFVSEDLGGRMISLCSNLRNNSTSHLSSQHGLESPYCTLHCPNGLGDRGWAEPENPSLPNVRIKLELFATKVHELLKSHLGTLPLLSFPNCYEAEFKEKLPVDETGVPLEHLITCVSGVELKLSSNVIKYLIWENKTTLNESPDKENKPINGVVLIHKCVSPSLATQQALFSRELVDLLKTTPHCQLPFSRFIPAYHHHFGRQCRVADYGHTRLVDLFEALSHVVQLLGDGNRRIITLTHSTQLRRFTSDLIRVLKCQAAKQIPLDDFASAYERVLSRPFDPVDYGLCDLSDLLAEISEGTVVIKKVEDVTIIAIPKREQTPAEILKTKQFTLEVIDLLRHTHQYRILFNKFVPAYHHHFGYQCRVSDYGFTKLIDLFEVIPDIVKVEETADGERTVSLTPKEALKVVCQQITSLVKSSRLQSISLAALPSIFLREYGYTLRPELFDCKSYEELLTKLSDSLQLVSGLAGPMIITGESIQLQLGIQIWSLLLNPPHKSTLSKLLQSFESKYSYPCTLQQIEKYRSIFEINKSSESNEVEISLTPRYALAARLYHLLYENSGIIFLGNLDGLYLRKYNKVLRPADYESTSLNTLLSQFSFLVSVRGRRNKRNVSLNSNIAEYRIPLPPNMQLNLINDGNNNTSSVSDLWPPPPAHTLFTSGKTCPYSPPKPDSPPAYANEEWYKKIWSPNASPIKFNIPLPFLKTPPPIGNPELFYSPMKHLLPAYPNTKLEPPICNLIPSTGKSTSPSKDSGIGCTSLCNSLEECDFSIHNESENFTNRYDFNNYFQNINF